MDREATLYPDAPWQQEETPHSEAPWNQYCYAQGRPQRRAAAAKMPIQGFESRATIPYWAIFISGAVVGAVIAVGILPMVRYPPW